MATAQVNSPGLHPWRTVVKKAFVENGGILHGNPNVIVSAGTGSPNGIISGVVGLLCYNVTDGDAYICTAAPSTWVKINA